MQVRRRILRKMDSFFVFYSKLHDVLHGFTIPWLKRCELGQVGGPERRADRKPFYLQSLWTCQRQDLECIWCTGPLPIVTDLCERSLRLCRASAWNYVTWALRSGPMTFVPSKLSKNTSTMTSKSFHVNFWLLIATSSWVAHDEQFANVPTADEKFFYRKKIFRGL